MFVAVTPMAFGEVLQARRLAEALVAAGDRVSFVAPREVHTALAGAPVRRGVLERLGMSLLDELIVHLAARERCDSVCLVDLAAVALTFAQHGLSLSALRALPLVALDLWNLAETERVFDFGTTPQRVPDDALAVRRLVPVPFARPDTGGAYNAWPAVTPLAPAARGELRARLGLPEHEPVIVMPSAAWQAPDRQPDARCRELATALPPLVLAQVARSPATLVHVGPTAWAPPGPRYRHVPQLPPHEFQALVAAADVVLTANLSATTIATALAAEVPVVAVTSDGRRLPPFRVWPLGLSRLLAPVLAHNPMLDCIRIFDAADDDGLAAALAPDPTWRERVRAYHARVAALPSPAARYAELTSC